MAKRKKATIINNYIETINGKDITINTCKPKLRRPKYYVARDNTTFCPNCNSTLALNENGYYYCTGDRLNKWRTEFIKFSRLKEADRNQYILDLSNYGIFLDIYDRWKYSIENPKEGDFNCGYNNNFLIPIGYVKITIPDPLVVKYLEKKLKRKLSLLEISNEDELYQLENKVLTKFVLGSNIIKIPYVELPSLAEIKYDPKRED